MFADARSLARMYAATVSEVDGVRLLDPATVERMTVVQTDKTRMHGLPPGLDIPADRSFYMSLGFWRACPPMPLVGPGSFGHPGSGGSVAFADPDAGVGFGYVTNLWSFRIGEPRASNLAAAVAACPRLGGLSRVGRGRFEDRSERPTLSHLPSRATRSCPCRNACTLTQREATGGSRGFVC